MMKYEHKQAGTAMLAILSIPVLGLLVGVLLVGLLAILPGLIFILAVVLATMVMFGSLTVTVDEQQVGLYFGSGFFRRSFPLRQISGVRVVRNSPLYGLGIHFIPGGIIYNVSGLDAVEITMENGRRIRIGSDEPAALARAIEEAKRVQGPTG